MPNIKNFNMHDQSSVQFIEGGVTVSMSIDPAVEKRLHAIEQQVRDGQIAEADVPSILKRELLEFGGKVMKEIGCSAIMNALKLGS